MSGIGEAIALAGLPGMGPRRLSAALAAWGPVEGLARVSSGRLERLTLPDGEPLLASMSAAAAQALATQWQVRVGGVDPTALRDAHAIAGVQVLLHGRTGYPAALADDLEPPPVLFVEGDLAALERTRVAIVGTRRCTGGGAGLARELARDLADADVAIVSGLALGIDGAAHRGALDLVPDPGAGPVGVVGSGLDVVYPTRHSGLWREVARVGVLLSEAPLGARPTAWRFPARNRVIAALAHAVVVVESHVAGGSLHTVTEAERRDIPVLAVPGSVRNPAAAGTNELIAQGCHPCRDATDVLVALGLTTARHQEQRVTPAAPDGDAGAVLDAFEWEPATLEHLAARTGLRLDLLALQLERLVADGWVEIQGSWYERVGGRSC